MVACMTIYCTMIRAMISVQANYSGMLFPTHTLLEGTASEAISDLKLTSANYEEAIAVLKRFGNKQQIISQHMEMLLNVDAVTLQYNLKGLRHLFDTVESQVRLVGKN